jgi:hypothetical protein
MAVAGCYVMLEVIYRRHPLSDLVYETFTHVASAVMLWRELCRREERGTEQNLIWMNPLDSSTTRLASVYVNFSRDYQHKLRSP